MLEKLKEKYIFFDVDGTLSEYRYNDKLYSGACPELGCQTLEDLLFSNLFSKARPLKTMQKIVSNLDSNKVFVLGTIVTNNEIEQKYSWLKKNYSTIKKENICFISNTMLKPEVIIEYCKHLNIKKEDVVFVDDRLDILRKAEELGITSYHPSSFME
ncbi:MAG TPA: HAD family hydrolase [Candidatus Faecimonas gallistercoris]|mgnify:CR=1 FL=1|nr:HAD family hydrolase [Candidatus Faecimonas gallistercoris]